MGKEGEPGGDRRLAWVGLVIVVGLLGWQLYLGATIQEIGIPGVTQHSCAPL